MFGSFFEFPQRRPKRMPIARTAMTARTIIPTMRPFFLVGGCDESVGAACADEDGLLAGTGWAALAESAAGEDAG
jgi:hypothetical protein